MTKKLNDEDIEKIKQESDGWKAKYLRALADYQNLEKRVGEQKQEFVRYAAEKLIYELLTVLDTLEKAQEHLNDPGLTLGIKNFKVILEANGLKKIEVLGKKFDPLEMECIEVVGESKKDEVIEELRSGYKLGDKVIRVAQVKVGEKSNIN
ncbi:nucleotide exchange factor GrpE [Candidatus Gottesmanbacteria bacterium]|nr:nucleotide exchange factor GrpE [Candidatus Gottesmanbacteria bacterium]